MRTTHQLIAGLMLLTGCLDTALLESRTDEIGRGAELLDSFRAARWRRRPVWARAGRLPAVLSRVNNVHPLDMRGSGLERGTESLAEDISTRLAARGSLPGDVFFSEQRYAGHAIDFHADVVGFARGHDGN